MSSASCCITGFWDKSQIPDAGLRPNLVHDNDTPSRCEGPTYAEFNSVSKARAEKNCRP